jgi:very-short-patch-repair endonuclease
VILWNHLNCRQLEGRKFRRQYSIDYYILDFYCPEEKLCIELDGQHHYTEAGRTSDVARDKYLLECGIKTLRFANSVVYNNMIDLL